MEQNRLTTDELRGMLDTYSPEQQLEENAKAICDAVKALAEVSTQVRSYMDILPALVLELRKVTSLTISEETKADIIQIGKDTGIAVSKAFKKNVDKVIAKAQKEIQHVTIPATMAYCLFYVFIFLITFLAIILFINGLVWHNGVIWGVASCLFGVMTPIIVITLLMCYKGWI